MKHARYLERYLSLNPKPLTLKQGQYLALTGALPYLASFDADMSEDPCHVEKAHRVDCRVL